MSFYKFRLVLKSLLRLTQNSVWVTQIYDFKILLTTNSRRLSIYLSFHSNVEVYGDISCELLFGKRESFQSFKLY